MITLYSKDFTTKYGPINSTIEAFVEEERNGLFELSFIMLNTDSLFNYVKEENIVVANANDTLLNQKFRIYMTRKLMNNRVEVFARHISFDLMYDYIDNVSFENQSCEYALNQLFRSSNFSKHYKGYSDIVNAQNYSMSMANVLEAIGGKEGSIIDTFGTGAEILRDNENIHVLNKRGYDNSVTIEYKKNLTGFELEEDTTNLVTRILPYAKYNNSETNEEIIIKADYVDSALIANYSHPYIASIDYSEKFEDGEIPTVSKLQELARKEYKDNKIDIPKQNFKIEFIPLSKCVGYEGLEDKISLCDTVTIKDTRYNINTQAKAIKTTFNVLKNKYESMELGDPKTSLGDIVGGGNDSTVGPQGPQGPQGPPGADGEIGDFPNSLPSTPVVTATVYGFANIEVSWTFENKIYYQYEVYASKSSNFTPSSFNLIYQGQASSFMYQAKPNEIWYFKVCCVNTHGERTSFGSASAATKKIDDLSNYVSNMAIDEALIGQLSLDRGWIGKLNANLLDVKGNFSVTDGNGKRTLDIDSFGNVNLDVTSLKISSSNVATESYASNKANTSLSNAKTYADDTANTAKENAINASKEYTNTKIEDTKAELKITTDSITQRVASTETILTNTTNTANNANNTANNASTKIDNLTTRMSSAEQKITADAIVSTVTNSTTYKNNLTGKVDTNKVISSINQTSESIKINANKIDINGTTTIGSSNSGRYVKIQNEDYGVWNGNILSMQFGYKNWNGWTGVPEFLMGYYGMEYSDIPGENRKNGYFGMAHFPEDNNPKNSTYGYHYQYYRLFRHASENYILNDDNGLMELSPHRYFNLRLGVTKKDYMSIGHDTGLVFPNGFSVGNAYCTFNNGASFKGNITTTGSISADGYFGNGEKYLKFNLSDWGILYPKEHNLYYIGEDGARWRNIYLGMNPNVTSDIRAKEDISYLNSDTNQMNKNNDIVSTSDMYNFVKDELNLAKYKYKGEKEETFGFIAQDIQNTKLGKVIIHEDSNEMLSYDTGAYMNTIAGALQKAIEKIEILEARIKELEEN